MLKREAIRDKKKNGEKKGQNRKQAENIEKKDTGMNARLGRKKELEEGRRRV